MNCPSCRGSMRTITYEGIEIESCDSCQGEWLDGDEIKKITDIREQRFDEATRRVIAESASYTGLPDKHLPDLDLICPKCGTETDPLNYGGGTGLILEKCTGCGGFWLDDGELEKVQMIVEGWDDALPDDQKKYGQTLSDIALATEILENVDEMEHSRLPLVGPFINACVNGILNLS